MSDVGQARSALLDAEQDLERQRAPRRRQLERPGTPGVAILNVPQFQAARGVRILNRLGMPVESREEDSALDLEAQPQQSLRRIDVQHARRQLGVELQP